MSSVEASERRSTDALLGAPCMGLALASGVLAVRMLAVPDTSTLSCAGAIRMSVTLVTPSDVRTCMTVSSPRAVPPTVVSARIGRIAPTVTGPIAAAVTTPVAPTVTAPITAAITILGVGGVHHRDIAEDLKNWTHHEGTGSQHGADDKTREGTHDSVWDHVQSPFFLVLPSSLVRIDKPS